uniref:Uncharacterized protein n=1 Tax=Panagrolaimus sp. PS1159 TaxID=55785 RepID=A0AC35ERP9_9BILA
MVKVNIGIDLGSFYSRVSAVVDETVSVIEIYDDRKLSSIVSLKAGKLLNGIKARNTASGNMILDACRFKNEQKYSETWCFAKINSQREYIIETKTSRHIVSQKDAIAALLGMLIDATEKKLGKNEIENVVITVPDYINQFFRCQILEAAKLAKINSVHLLTQNTAAAITYIRNKPQKTFSTFMIFNFGANQLSISLFENSNGNIQLIYSESEESLGGEDFTTLLTEIFLEILKQHEGNNFIPGTKTLKGLRETAEKAKIDLSLMDQTECNLENVEEQRCHAIHLSREEFEKFCNSLINKTEKCILNAIQNCKQNISEIIMVGGASRIFVVKQILKRLLPNSTFNSTLVPEEAIVFGAAIKAEMLNKSLSTSSLIGDIQNTAKSSIYCKTDFGKIQIIKSLEVLPSTPRCFSYFNAVPKIEFFEKSMNLESLGFIENIPENSYFLCEFDNNGILKCFINEKPAVLKQKKELSNVDDKATTTITSNEMKQNLNSNIGTQNQSEKESFLLENSKPPHPSIITRENQNIFDPSNSSRNVDNVKINNKALINSYGSNQTPPIPVHHTNPINSENKVYGSNNSIYTAKTTSPNNSLTSYVNSTTTYNNDNNQKSLINQQHHQQHFTEPIPSHNFVNTHPGYINNNAINQTSDRDPSWVKVNTSDAQNVAEQPHRYPTRSSSSSNQMNDRTTTSSSYPTSRNNPETLKEKEKNLGKFPSETRF